MKSTLLYLAALVAFFAGALCSDLAERCVCHDKGGEIQGSICVIDRAKKTPTQPTTPAADPSNGPANIWPIVPPIKKDKK